MRLSFPLFIALLVTACSPGQLEGLLSDGLQAESFAVTCKTQAATPHYAEPDKVKRGFPESAEYNEIACNITYAQAAWDGPFQSLNWNLPLTLTQLASGGPGKADIQSPYRSFYDLHATGIRKGGVLMGLLGSWRNTDAPEEVHHTLDITTARRTITVPFTISPIDPDYQSVPVAPPAQAGRSCNAGKEVICLRDENGEYWTSVLPQSRGQDCAPVAPINRVGLDKCGDLSMARSCPAATVYCARLDAGGKRGWQTKVQSRDCREHAEYEQLDDQLCG